MANKKDVIYDCSPTSRSYWKCNGQRYAEAGYVKTKRAGEKSSKMDDGCCCIVDRQAALGVAGRMLRAGGCECEAAVTDADGLQVTEVRQGDALLRAAAAEDLQARRTGG